MIALLEEITRLPCTVTISHSSEVDLEPSAFTGNQISKFGADGKKTDGAREVIVHLILNWTGMCETDAFLRVKHMHMAHMHA